MMAATHRLGGLAAGTMLVTTLQVSLPEASAIIAASVIGSLIPDIDNSHSNISHKWRITSVFVTIGQGIIRFLAHLFPRKQRNYICSLIGHRGLTHSLLPVLLSLLIAPILSQISSNPSMGEHIAVGLAAGILSHLLFDMFAGGVPLLMPFSVRRIRLASIKTGGIAEWLFRFILISFFAGIGSLEAYRWINSL